MRKTIAVAFAMLMIASGASAQERATGAALGAVSGAVVLGPVGAVAGALIGYTAGPAISRSWGARGRGASPRHTQRTARQDARTRVSESDPRSQANAQMITQPRPAAPSAAAKAPPVQPLE